MIFEVLSNNASPTFNERAEALDTVHAHNDVKWSRSIRNADNPNHVDIPFYRRLRAVKERMGRMYVTIFRRADSLRSHVQNSAISQSSVVLNQGVLH